MKDADPKQGAMLTAKDADEIIRLANILYFRSKAFERTHWMGVPAAKCPMDMWMYQELMFRLKTDLIIETGTLLGGSALFFAHMLDILGQGKIISVDIAPRPDRPQHPRIQYIQGSSLDTDVLAKIQELADSAKSVLVNLDADHHADFKLAEMRCYAKFVTPGSYLIAEDSGFDYYPAWPEFGRGPAHAVRDFLKDNPSFVADRSLEHHLITFSPHAFLKRIS